jgi:hypothetical protein
MTGHAMRSVRWRPATTAGLSAPTSCLRVACTASRPVALRGARESRRAVVGPGANSRRWGRVDRLWAVCDRSRRWLPAIRGCSERRCGRTTLGCTHARWTPAQPVRDPDLRRHSCGGAGQRRLGRAPAGVPLGRILRGISHRDDGHIGAVRRCIRWSPAGGTARRRLPAHLDRDRLGMAHRPRVPRVAGDCAGLKPAACHNLALLSGRRASHRGWPAPGRSDPPAVESSELGTSRMATSRGCRAAL